MAAGARRELAPPLRPFRAGPLPVSARVTTKAFQKRDSKFQEIKRYGQPFSQSA
jgi:hypothetical protein